MSEEEMFPTITEDEGKPDNVSWGDWMLKEDKPLSHRHVTIAYMMASGVPNQRIAKDLGLTPARVSVLISNSRIKQRAKEIQADYMGGSLEKSFREAAPKALNVMTDIIDDPCEKHKTALKFEASKWMLEKVTGKAVQQVQVESNTIGALFDQMDLMKKAGQVITVGALAPSIGTEAEETAPEEPAQDKMDKWVEDNLFEGDE